MIFLNKKFWQIQNFLLRSSFFLFIFFIPENGLFFFLFWIKTMDFKCMFYACCRFLHGPIMTCGVQRAFRFLQFFDGALGRQVGFQFCLIKGIYGMLSVVTNFINFVSNFTMNSNFSGVFWMKLLDVFVSNLVYLIISSKRSFSYLFLEIQQPCGLAC